MTLGHESPRFFILGMAWKQIFSPHFWCHCLCPRKNLGGDCSTQQEVVESGSHRERCWSGKRSDSPEAVVLLNDSRRRGESVHQLGTVPGGPSREESRSSVRCSGVPRRHGKLLEGESVSTRQIKPQAPWEHGTHSFRTPRKRWKEFSRDWSKT